MTDAPPSAQQVMARLGTGPAMSQQVLNTLGAGTNAFNMTGPMNPSDLSRFDQPGMSSRAKHAWLDKTYSPAEMDKLQQQWGQTQIDDFDFGRLRETNPLAYIGWQATARGKHMISEYQTPLTAVGMTFPENPNKKAADYDVVANALHEAGVDPNSAAGHILLGPEFASGKDTYTMEHELMHRGIMELYRRKQQFEQSGDLVGWVKNTAPLKRSGFDSSADDMQAIDTVGADQESMLNVWEYIHGLDKLHQQAGLSAKDYFQQEDPYMLKQGAMDFDTGWLDRLQDVARANIP